MKGQRKPTSETGQTKNPHVQKNFFIQFSIFGPMGLIYTVAGFQGWVYICLRIGLS